jgi:DNA-directed RNA polymerase specialized sigma24 family protein
VPSPELPGLATVSAARAGDPLAAQRLVDHYLPLVFNLVGRAARPGVDIAGVVRQTMAVVADGLPGLPEPDLFRPWLLATALRGLRAADRKRATGPTTDFVDTTVAQLGLSGQRREAAEATRWMADEDRELLAMWWLEVGGELDRSEVVAASGRSDADVANGISQLQERFDDARAVVRALAAMPRCPDVADQLSRWYGPPTERQRRALARHARSCSTCVNHREDLISTDRLLRGFPLVPPPPGFPDQPLPIWHPPDPDAPRPLEGPPPEPMHLPGALSRFVHSPVVALVARVVAVGIALAVMIGSIVSYAESGPNRLAPANTGTSAPAPPTHS